MVTKIETYMCLIIAIIAIFPRIMHNIKVNHTKDHAA